jgi:hypothetical protein
MEPNVFQEYLTFFRQQLRTSREAAGAGPSIHTVSEALLVAGSSRTNAACAADRVHVLLIEWS